MGLRSFLSYLLGKKSELEDLELKDAMLAKVVLDIHRKRSHKDVVFVPLFALFPVHVLDRESAIRATRERADHLGAHRDELLAMGKLSCDSLAKYLPSVSWIKVVENTPGEYLSFEGNGRIAALQMVFDPGEALEVEVELYRFKNKVSVLRRLNRVRRMNGLL